MDVIIPAFQFEIRFNHILNFSQIARNLLAPYVRLTHTIKIDKQNTVEETYSLLFEEDDYLIIISWDRIVFKGQGSLDTYVKKNSPLNILFFDIFDKISELKEFGEIQRSSFFGISISKYSTDNSITDNSILDFFSKKTFTFDPNERFKELNDIAVVFESNPESGIKNVSYGPYFGSEDLNKRDLRPLNIESLGDIDFRGIMLYYKRVKITSKIDFKDFVDHCSEFNDTFKKIWKN